MTDRPFPRYKNGTTRSNAAFVLIEMLIAIALFAIFILVGMRLISVTLHLSSEISRAENVHVAFDSALARLRQDAWSAKGFNVSAPGAAALDFGDDTGVVSWAVREDGALVRTTAPPNGTSDVQAFPAAGEGVLFRREDPGVLVLDIPSKRGRDNGTYRFYSQLLLAMGQP